jgi:hypothetical protein
MALKPQDVYVVLKLAADAPSWPGYAELARALSMSASEVHASLQRARESQLVFDFEDGPRPNFLGVKEFLVHGLKYAFPAEMGGMTRGMPTSYAADPLKKVISRGVDPVPVWPSADGDIRGLGLEPLYKSAPLGASRDPLLYEYLALVDALRCGRARERSIAAEELTRRLDHANARYKY